MYTPGYPQACGISAAVAAEQADQVAQRHCLFERPLGVLGRWGGITRAWLDDVLPPDAVDRCRDRVRLVVTQVDLRRACSVHQHMHCWGNGWRQFTFDLELLPFIRRQCTVQVIPRYGACTE